MADFNDRMGNREDEAQLRYLRAADYAQERRYAEAEAEFSAALDMNPALHTCRFQLGLLQLTNAEPDKARITWAALYNSSVPPELQQFARGLESLICDEFDSSIALLESGIALNQSNPALNKDMKMVIDRIQTTIAENQANTTVKQSEKSELEPLRTDFSLYGNKG